MYLSIENERSMLADVGDIRFQYTRELAVLRLTVSTANLSRSTVALYHTSTYILTHG